MYSVLGNISCNLDDKVNVKDKKRVYTMVYHRLRSRLALQQLEIKWLL